MSKRPSNYSLIHFYKRFDLFQWLGLKKIAEKVQFSKIYKAVGGSGTNLIAHGVYLNVVIASNKIN